MGVARDILARDALIVLMHPRPKTHVNHPKKKFILIARIANIWAQIKANN